MKIIILAGGSGTRLWPMSRVRKPKQFSKILNNKTMIECTLDRFTKEFNSSDIYISTIPEFVKKIREILPAFPLANIIVEPEKRDSGPAMGYVAVILNQKWPDEPVAFIPSDHFISDNGLFIKSIKVADQIIKETEKMVDIAIPPNFPSIVLGYTRVGEQYREIDGIQVYQFKGHVEKPDYKKAKQYLEEGDYLWHANYYMWTPKLFLEAYKKYAPNLSKPLTKIQDLLKEGKKDAIAKEYKKMDKISIDYAVTEKMNPADVLIIKGAFGWSDIGAWDVLYDQSSKKFDQDRNLVRGNHLGVDTSGSLIYGSKEKLIATIGVDDLIIIDTDDALLICPHGRAQDVKKAVEELEKRKKSKYL